MKKLLYVVFVFSFCLFGQDVNSSNLANSTNITSETSSNEEFVDSVEAQDAKGYNTMYLGIYGRRMANGKYHYYAKTKGGTREFSIQHADNNRYKPFYVTINGERWYFASRTLDYNSGKTDQW